MIRVFHIARYCAPSIERKAAPCLVRRLVL